MDPRSGRGHGVRGRFRVGRHPGTAARKIAFSSGPNERLSTAQIYVVHANGTGHVMSADGSHMHRLTFTTAPEMAPAWSPDGRWIVFGRGKPRASLFLIPAAGGKARLLVPAPGISFDQPDWQRLP